MKDLFISIITLFISISCNADEFLVKEHTKTSPPPPVQINITNNDISITNKLSEPILYITVENEEGEIILTEPTYIESNQSQTISLSETESSEYTIYIESEETITNISFTN